MKLAISNIAWDTTEDEPIAAILSRFPVRGIEVAPTKIWSPPTDAPIPDILRYKEFWQKRGFNIPSMQSLLFGRPDLSIFSNRDHTLDYLKRIIVLAGRLGAEKLVFGSPKNRLRQDLTESDSINLAISFFSEIAEFSMLHHVVFCMEPNPVQYGCDFITNTREGVELVREVNHPHFRLHLDAAAMTLNVEDYGKSIELGMPYLEHFHISEPFLDLIGTKQTDHSAIYQALQMNGYSNWVSVEMKSGLRQSNQDAVYAALAAVSRYYQ